MRPYLVLAASVLIAAAAFGQQPFPHPAYGPCGYGCSPFVPLLTTPMISLQQVSPNPVGASNATTGLIAGATNSTLSQIQGSTSSVYTVPVWYQGGGAPVIAPQVSLSPEPIGHEGRAMHEDHVREFAREEHGPRKEVSAGWTYYTSEEHTSDAALIAHQAKGGKKANRIYNNDDVTRQNDKNGTVKYDGKTEKI